MRARGRGGQRRPGGCVQAFGGGEGGSGLDGALLGLAQSGDGFGERGQPGDQDDRHQGPVAGEAGERGHDPGGLPQPVPAGVGAGIRP